MASNRGLETVLSVFLLCCWPGIELQPTTKTLGPVTDNTLNSTNEEMPEVFDEILAQEILEPNSSSSETEAPSTKLTSAPTLTTTQTKDKDKSADENYQDGSENYHELLENLEVSDNENTDKNDTSTVQNIHGHSSQTKLEPHFSSEAKKRSSNKYGKASVLDKILQNIGRSKGSLELTERIF